MIYISHTAGAVYTIYDDDERVGWIDDGRVGFRGFASEARVRSALIQVWRAHDRLVLSARPSWAWRHAADIELSLEPSAGAEQYVHGGEFVGRLIRPHPRAYDASFGLEISVPSFVQQNRLLQVAQSTWSAIRALRGAADVSGVQYPDTTAEGR